MKKENPSLSAKPPSNVNEGGFLLNGDNFVTNMAETAGIYPYKLCKLLDAKGDINKRWYIEYYAWHPIKRELLRQRLSVPTKFNTDRSRRTWAKQAMAEIDKMLKNGSVIGTEPRPKPESVPVIYFVDAVAKACKEHADGSNRKKTKITYKMYETLIAQWAHEKGYSKLLAKEFKKNHCIELFDWIVEVKKPSNRTFNNHRAFVKSILNTMKRRELMDGNPMDAIGKRQIEESPNLPFRSHEKKLILESITDPVHLFFVKFMYYSLCRPNEVRLLQVKHVSFDKIQVTGGNSKNKKTQFVLVTEPLRKLLEEMQVLSFPADYYVFGGRYALGEQTITRLHTKLLRGLGFGTDYTLYSWKDTGACDLYQATRDIEFVSRQCRHHSLDQTKRYLAGMGLLLDHKNVKLAPELP